MSAEKEPKKEVVVVRGIEISSAISAGYLVGWMFGPIFAVPGFILGGVAARLYADPGAREAVSRFISPVKPK
ncbi:MAG: hypothetical protein Q7R49_04160 [Candidatus Daviesbacteria bacterium]|nr:hypothetical protein [Candidatus Daviesbacteria bacterium]